MTTTRAAELAGPPRPALRLDRQRARVPLHPLAEAAARVCFAYARDQHELRSRRGLPRYLGRTARFLWEGARRPLLEARMGSLDVLLSSADRTMARSVYAAGDWDPLLVGTVFDALRRWGHVYAGTTFLEVGANFGVYCLPAVAEWGFARAVAYEPEAEAYGLLSENVRRNGLQARVQSVHAALSREPGELRLRRGGSNAGDNRIVSGDEPDTQRTAVSVRASTIDLEIEAGAIRPAELGLVWLDVQGHETEVLAGASRLLEAGVPLVLEYSTSMMGEESRRELHRLLAASYRALVDLGWCALTNKLTFQPAHAIDQLAAPGRPLETDLLLL